MADSSKKSRRTRSANLRHDTPTTTISPTSGQQLNKATKRPSVPTIRTTGADAASNGTGLTQSFDDFSMVDSLSHGSTGLDNQHTSCSPGKRSKNEKDHYIDVSTEFLRTKGKEFVDQKSKIEIRKKALASYSRDQTGKLETTKRKIDYYHGLALPKNGLDLLTGYKADLKPQEQSQEFYMFSITKFDEYLSGNKDLTTEDRPNFVGTVGTFRRLMCAPFENKKEEEWNVYAKRVHEIWYLSEGWRSHDDGVPADAKYAARMFELLMTEGRSLGKAAQEAKDFLKYAHSYEVRRASIGEHSLLYSGEVDCCDRASNGTIELKTKNCTERSKKIEDDTARRYWAQAYLMSNERIQVGYLDSSTKGKRILFCVDKIDPEPATLTYLEKVERGTCFACLDRILTEFKEDFFQEAVTYVLRLDTKSKKIVASKSDIDLPLKVASE